MESPPRPQRLATALAVIAMLALPGLATAGTGAGGAGVGPAWGPPEEPVYSHLLVVGPRDWHTSIEPLMTWRERTSNADAHFLALEDAYANGTGLDGPARLKDAIARAVQANGPLKALVLLGDGGVVPVRRVFVNITGSGDASDPLNLRWSDDYYVVGGERTWDRDGDGDYGEGGEVLGEVAQAYSAGTPPVGRIPATNAVEVSRFVTKLLAYERSPPEGDWYRRALLAGGLMDVPNVLDNPYTPDVDGGYDPASDNAYESHELLRKAFGPDWDVTWLYDYPYREGGRWNLSVDNLDHGRLVTAFDRGNAVVSMNMHGYTDSTGLSHYNGTGVTNYWWDWSTAYDWRDADQASNVGMLPWVFVAACYVGDVSLPGDRTLGRLVLNPGGGAVGMVAGNGENYKGEFEYNGSYGNWWLEREYWRNHLGTDGIGSPGAALVATKARYLDLVTNGGVPRTALLDAYAAADYLTYNLLGDPLTNVWRERPGRMRVETVEDDGEAWRSTPSRDAVLLRVVDGEGAPVHGVQGNARWAGGASFVREREDGWYSLEAPLDAGELDIVLWRGGLVPVELRVERPVTALDMEVAEAWWGLGGGPTTEWPASNESVELGARILFHGRYEYNQTRARFQVSYGDLPPVTLAPDTWAAVNGFGESVARKAWQPPHAPGSWRVLVTVEPGLMPDADATNNKVELEVYFRGPPQWAGLPGNVTVDCRGAPGGTLALAPYLRDPDTPLDGLLVEATALGGAATTVRLDVGPGRVLSVRPLQGAPASFDVRLEVTDGTSSASAVLHINLLREVPSVRLVAPGPVEARVGSTASGVVRVEPVEGSDATRVSLLVEMGPEGLLLDPSTGAFSFTPVAAGEHVATVKAMYDPGDGSATVEVASTVLVLRATRATDLPPAPVGWTRVRAAAGSTAELRLQAVDPEGARVTFSLSEPGGPLRPTVSADGLVRLDLSRTGPDDYALDIVLSDGSSTVTVPLEVEVTPAPGGAGGTGYGPYLVLGAVAFLAAAVVWRARTSWRGRKAPKS